MNAILYVLDKSDIVHSIGDCRRNSKLSTLSLSLALLPLPLAHHLFYPYSVFSGFTLIFLRAVYTSF